MLKRLCSLGGVERVLRFCCIGALNTAIAFCLYLFFSAVMSLYAANALSWGLACLSSYFMNRAWTFRAADTGFSPLAKFVFVNLCSLGIGLTTMYVFVGLGGGRIWSYVFSLPLTMTASYLGYRFWSFKNVDDRK
ncbi:MAG: GtrA family protein [Proteobacteria bacterium]|nr:GtrA family protein [Cystobacterineae bacterium]MCL2258560.1 GtrA family protein [Cystobacterineae bacterium]MCL2315137.1 GtrA family protein [Pseudomonadota bacterium]